MNLSTLTKPWLLALALGGLILSSAPAALVVTMLVPPADPVSSGMTEARATHPFLGKRDSAGYWRFVEICEATQAKTPAALRTPGWAGQIAAEVARELATTGVDPISPGKATGTTPLVVAVRQYEDLFDPTTPQYRDFYAFAVRSRYSSIIDARSDYERVLAQQRKPPQTAATGTSNTLDQFHSARQPTKPNDGSRPPTYEESQRQQEEWRKKAEREAEKMRRRMPQNQGNYGPR